ncbi:MAG: glycosyltransferase family 39 protein [Caldilineaceae bacterium]|nr:glycosyltransferase family 39 protein [Caldilineaceae bacterium]
MTPERAFAARPSTHLVLAAAWIGSVFVCATTLIFLFFFRQLNLDEGWYLWASRSVYAGKLLYRDFAYTQTPLLPYVYGLIQTITGVGLVEGRLTTMVLALLAWGIVSGCARKLAGPWAAVLTLLLLGSSVYAAAHFVYTATYALTALWLALALYVALPPTVSAETVRNAAAILFFCCAIATRLSVAVALIPFALYLILSSRDRLRAAVTVGISGVIGAAILFGPFWIAAGEQMRYSILEFHTAGALGYTTHLFTMLLVLRHTLIDFALPLGITALALIWLIRRRRSLPTWGLPWLAVSGMVLSLFAVHLLPRTTGSYYNSLQTPLLALLVAVSAAPILARLTRGWAIAIVLAALTVNGGLQIGGILREDLVSVPPQNRMDEVREAVTFLRSYVEAGDLLLSFNTHLALEADLDLPAGMEMSIFSYHPTWTDEAARRYGGINNNRLLALLDDPRVAVAAMTTFDLNMLYGARAEILDALHRNFRWAITIPNIGPHLQELRIYLPPQFEPPAPSVPLRVPLEDGILFLGYDLTERIVNEEHYLHLGLYWQAMQTPAQSYTVFSQLLDQNGQRVAGWDNPPCRATCPTSGWLPGEVIRDEYWLPISALPAGEYQLIAGMYDPASGDRLPVQLEDGGIHHQILLTRWRR